MNPWRWLFLVLVFGCVSPEGNGRILPYHVEDFFRSGALSPPQLSPNGQQIAYVTSRRGRPAIILHDIDEGKDRQFYRAPRDDISITALHWFSPERLIYQINFGTIVAQDLDGMNRQELFTGLGYFAGANFLLLGQFEQAVLLHLLPEDPDHLLLHVRSPQGLARVERVNVFSGESTVVQDTDPPASAWFADHDGLIRAGQVLEEKKVSFLHRESGDSVWSSLDQLLPPDQRHRFAYSGKTFVGRRHTLVGFDPDPDLIYFASNAGRDKIALYSMRISTGEQTLIAEDPEYDLLTALRDDRFQLIFSPRTKALVGVAYDAKKPTVKWLDDAFSRLQAVADTRFPTSVNRLVSMDQETTRFIFLVSSSREKGQYHLYDSERDAWRLLGSADPSTKAIDMSATQPIRFTARGGHTLFGYLTVPKAHPEGQPNQMIVLAHGGPWVRDRYRFDPEVQYLAYHGFTVLQVNFRGSLGYGFEHTDALRQNIGTPAFEDLMDGVDWAIEQGHADPDRIIAMGASYGGYATLQLLTGAPDRFKAGVAIAGVYDFVEQMRFARQEHSRFASEFWQEMVGGFWNRKQLRNMSPLHNAARIQAPLFLAHGDEDPVVSVHQATKLEAALKASGKEHEVLILKGEGHGATRLRNKILLYERILEFLNRHLPKE